MCETEFAHSVRTYPPTPREILPWWGPLMRAGNDKSHLARQVERYADVYTSRVSNLLYATPFVYLRSPRGSLPHDPLLPGGRAIV